MSSSSSSSTAAAGAEETTTTTAPLALPSGGTPQEKLAAMLADPRYIQGVSLTKQGKYEEALEFLGACVALVASEDDLSLAAAPVYFAYGDALLSKAEDSFDLFGAAMKEAKEKGGDGDEEEGEEEDVEEEEEEEEEEQQQQQQDNGKGKEVVRTEVGSSTGGAVAASSSSAAEGGGEQEEGDAANKVSIPEEMQDDLEVAWENLEASRVIYHKYEDCVDAKKIGEVYLRLGDLQKSNGNYTQSVEDYLQSLAIYGKVCGEDSRVIADLHYQLATAYIYASGVEEAQAAALKTKGLEHYIKCAHVFELLVAKAQKDAAGNGKAPMPAGAPKTTPEEDVKEFSEILDELKETIEATKQELRAMGPGAAKPAAGPVTTVGFGAPTTATAAAVPTNGAAGEAGKAAEDGNTENQAANVNVMAVKKKAKPAAPAAAAAAAAAPAVEGGEESAKKRVVDQTEGPAEPPAAKEARTE